MSLIRSRRIKAGLTMTEVAARAEMRLPMLSKIERGHRKLRIDEIARLARAIGCSPSDLIPDLESEAVTHE